MRPQQLFGIFASLKTIPGIGERTKECYERLLGGGRIVDLLFHFPISLIDRRHMPDIPKMQKGQIATALVRIDKHIEPKPGSRKGSPLRVRCYNESGFLHLVYFHTYKDFLQRTLPIGQVRAISGKVDNFAGGVQIVHPDYVVPASELEKIKIVEPIYPLSAGVTQKQINKSIKSGLQKLPDFDEWIDTHLRDKYSWPSWNKAMMNIHNPQKYADIDIEGQNYIRLAYDELLANQLALKLSRKAIGKSRGRITKGSNDLKKRLYEYLPFKLTQGQIDVINEIAKDQASSHKMMRLLQGDVGSGKTVVALFAMITAVEAGRQSAIMVPTEILSKQHFKWISEIAANIGIRVGYLAGSVKGKKRESVLEELKEGKIDILVGTHALFQEGVEFKDLSLVVIDEQHRFGVKQRMGLASKGNMVDTLLMTATPIPRTLALTLYGDMDVSSLIDKPMGRKPIDTRVLPVTKIKSVVDGIRRVIEKGQKVYWICPLIEESEVLNLAAAEDRFKILQKTFKGRVGLVHGRMTQEEREPVMREFRDGNIDILVATTVVEVGVDVPDATVIIIEHAERFGLAQLHQLRGRVGRSDKKSSCVLLYDALSSTAKERLKIMRETNDGFLLAERDLKIRGGGDIMGTKQSGLPEFKIANLYTHFDLLKIANDDAELILNKDPGLRTKRGEALRVLLYLFDYDQQIKYLKV